MTEAEPWVKKCTKCKLILPLDKFHARNSRPGGLAKQSKCKECSNADSRAYSYKPQNFARKRQQNIIRRAAYRSLIDKIKAGPCLDCHGSFPPYTMQFDHRDPKTKKFNISQSSRRPDSILLEEIAKCDVVCANCHAIRTYERRQMVGRPRRAK